MPASPERLSASLLHAASRRGVRIGLYALLACAFVVLALTPPPAWLLSPLSDYASGFYGVGPEGLNLRLPDGALLSIAPESNPSTGTIKARFESIAREAFLQKQTGSELDRALAEFPQTLDLKSSVYLIGFRGGMPAEVSFSAPVPGDAQPSTTLDLYAWDGAHWDFVPSLPAAHDMREANVRSTAQALVLAQTKTTEPIVSTELDAATNPPQTAALGEVNPLGLTVNADGSLRGTFVNAPVGAPYAIIPVIADVERPSSGPGPVVVRYDIVSNVLIDDQTRNAHVQAVSNFVVQHNLQGVQLDYEGLRPEMRDRFSQFVQELSAELHTRGKSLSVSVPLPAQNGPDDYDTGAYDWSAIGSSADGVEVPAPVGSNAYVAGGAMEHLLQWAVARVNRYKLILALDTRVQDRVNDQTTQRDYDDALKSLLGQIKVEGVTAGGALPLQDVRLSLDLAPGFNGFARDPDTGAFVYGYLDQSANLHTVSLETAESITFKMALASRYHLRGIAFRGLSSDGANASLWATIARYRQSAPPGAPKYQLVWTVTDSHGKQVQVSEPQDLLSPLSFLWRAAPTADRYTIGAVISSTDDFVRGESVAIQVVNPTAAPNTPGVSTHAGVTPGALLGPRGPTPTRLPSNTPTITRTAGPTRTATPTRTPAPTQAATPVAPSPSNGGAFGYGIQVDANDNLSFVVGKVRQMGFGWVKLQMQWKDMEPAPGVYNWWDSRIDAFSNNGIMVMLSIVKAPRWARAANSDFSQEGPPSDEHIGDFANFLGQVAARYQGKVGAIEVWNEENIRNEWGGEPFDAARYVRILCAGYAQIKASNRGMLVISGALTPTGAYPPLAVPDQVYLRNMYAAGVKNCADAIGAHPSGYANAPDVYYTGGDPDPTRGYDDHPSFYFRNTMEDYHRIMVANGDGAKKIWATEFGWGVWRYTRDQRFVYMQSNTLQKQADWTVKAYQMGKSWGWAGVMFLWNLDYAITCDCENANFGILTGQGDTPAFSALVNMAK